MNNTIDVLSHSTASILIFRMMCQLDEKKGSKYELRELFNMHSESNDVEIKITVNGVEVDPIKCLESCWNQLDNAFEDNAKQIAKKMVSMAGLEELQEKIQQAEYDINNAVDIALEKLKCQQS